MHLIYKNLLKNLIQLWTEQFKGLNEGDRSYEFNPKVWEAIGAATAASGSTVLGAFSTRPWNVANNKTTCTVDMWSFWLLYIGPVLLAHKFHKQVYYTPCRLYYQYNPDWLSTFPLMVHALLHIADGIEACGPV